MGAPCRSGGFEGVQLSSFMGGRSHFMSWRAVIVCGWLEWALLVAGGLMWAVVVIRARFVLLFVDARDGRSSFFGGRSCPFLVVVGGGRLWVVGVGVPRRWWAFVGYEQLFCALLWSFVGGRVLC